MEGEFGIFWARFMIPFFSAIFNMETNAQSSTEPGHTWIKESGRRPYRVLINQMREVSCLYVHCPPAPVTQDMSDEPPPSSLPSLTGVLRRWRVPMKNDSISDKHAGPEVTYIHKLKANICCGGFWTIQIKSTLVTQAGPN